ncbi:hypothetical protein [Spirosoma sp. KUDC1026]|uniref:hypothetical protein n=1 Tax=Spirosoma sp. KUDC1026 TaxID=2745947 RepID=UPI00159BD23A|nr:hypothetical protein [Spirosoma sp. KUDC1026]QKZ11334.1 hypothetical protein HU175_01250 [Spirosoma sp. KUDC1026]
MKTFFLLALCLLALAACSPQAQLVTLRGNNVQTVPDKGLVLDNDTLTLTYDFSSSRGLMHITLVNKLQQPLYVDWKRSSFIIGQNKLDYWYDVANVNLSGSFAGSGLYRRYSTGSLSGTITKEDAVGFIPPNTKIEKKDFVVVPQGNLLLKGQPEITHQNSKADPGKKQPIVVSIFNYSEEKSPLTFRNYLTLSTDKDFKNEFHIDTQFWASDVRVLPKAEIVAQPVLQYDNTYSTPTAFRKPDGFYITLPQ